MNDLIKVRFAGIGGQGIIISSVIFGNAAILDGLIAVQTQSYGPEQRGGKLKSDVLISKGPNINYPVINDADVLIAMSQESFNDYSQFLSLNAVVLIDSDHVHPEIDIQRDIMPVAATKAALKLGSRIVANIVMIGALTALKPVVSPNSIRKSIKALTRKKFVSINLKAFELGFSLLK